MNTVPTFAVVGAVNHGKSSVVAALVEDETIRISPIPGETAATKRHALRDLLVLHDTPGFQNARRALDALDAEPGDAADPLAPYRRFVARHRDDPAFDAECRLLAPVLDGAGIVYVVDASQPLRDLHRCEMEFLRRTGAPRLAIVNRSDDSGRADAWDGLLQQHFNLVRVFDSHVAAFEERRDFVEALAAIDRRWKVPLRDAVHALDEEQAARLRDGAAAIADAILRCLAHVERDRVARTADDREKRAAIARLRSRFVDAITGIERGLHRRLLLLFAHGRASTATDDLPRFDDDLFADETWRLLGLDAKQLVAASAITGGVVGAGLDAATLGHSLGIGAALGAAVGAGGAFALGKRRPDIAIDWPASSLPSVARRWLPNEALRFGGNEVVAGPLAAENFPWVVLDRALAVFAYAATRSHARRDVAVARPQALVTTMESLGLTVAHWPDAERRRAQRVFASARRKRPTSEQLATLEGVLGDALARLVASERPIAAALGPVGDAQRRARDTPPRASD